MRFSHSLNHVVRKDGLRNLLELNGAWGDAMIIYHKAV